MWKILKLAGFLALALTLLPFGSVMADDPVIAKVGDEQILRSDIEAAFQNLPDEYKSVPFPQIFPMLLTSMIDSKLVAADARARKLDQDPEYQKNLKMVADQLLERVAVRQEIDKAMTDEKLRMTYNETYADGAVEVHARHILLKTADEANAVIKELAGGADFGELAKAKSTGPSASRGGDLGFFAKGQMVPAFETAAFDLAPGKYTNEPVQTQFGYHVIKVEERRKADAPAFEEVVDELRQKAAQDAGSAYVERLREGAKIERFNIDGSKVEQ